MKYLKLIFLALISSVASAEPNIVRPSETLDMKSDRIPVVHCIDLDETGQFLAHGGDDHHVHVLSLLDGERIELTKHIDWVRGVAFSPDRKKLAAVAQDGLLQIWNASPKWTESVSTNVSGQSLQSVVFHPSGNWVAVSGHEKSVFLVDAKTGKKIRTFDAHSESNRAIDFSPDGKLLAAGGLSGVVRVWNVETGKMLYQIEATRRINAVAFSPDSQALAIGGESPFISIWSAKDGSSISTLPERPGKTYSLVFCEPNRLASGESDNVIRIWQLDRAECTATLVGHTGTIAALAYDAAGKRLISGGFDTTIRFWLLP